jgi:hypothetical protein
VVGDGGGEGEELACAASLEDGDFGSSELCGLSLSASCDFVEPLCVFAEDEAVDFCLFAARDVDGVEDLELVFAPLGDLDAAELFVPALLEVPDFVWLVTLAFGSLEVV